jgi:hypothetical protein
MNIRIIFSCGRYIRMANEICRRDTILRFQGIEQGDQAGELAFGKRLRAVIVELYPDR